MRTAAVALAAAGLVTLPWASSPAHAGGSCHRDLSSGTGTVVKLDHACFYPSVTNVAPGDTVRFINDGGLPHTITESIDGPIGDIDVAIDETVSIVFPDPGLYSYYCKLHPNMRGAVAVALNHLTDEELQPEVHPAAAPSTVSVAETVDDGVELGGGALAGAGAGVALLSLGAGFALGRRPRELTAPVES